MADSLPRAGFADPLLKDRARRRTAHFKATLSNPLVIVALIAAVALALVEPWLVPVAWLLVIVVAFVLADRRAKAEWWVSLLDHLGLEPSLVGDPAPLSPLLRSGDEREVLRAAHDDSRQLLIFRSTDVSRDSKGNTTRTHHDFTVVLMRSATPAIRFLSAHEHRFAPMKFLGDDLRGQTMRGIEEFKVESVQLDERFTLRSSAEDGVRARQIFKPSFIVWFTHSGVPFEYEGGDLVVFVDRVLEHAEEFKMLLSRADEIDRAIRGEAPQAPPPS